MAIVRNDKIFRYLKADGTNVWFRYDVDQGGAYQFVFQTGTSAGDQTLIAAQTAFTNQTGYPGATITTGNVFDAAIFSGVTYPDGSAASPSITFTNEPTTGFYRAGAGQIGVTILGANSLTFAANGVTINSQSTAQSITALTIARAGQFANINSTTDIQIGKDATTAYASALLRFYYLNPSDSNNFLRIGLFGGNGGTAFTGDGHILLGGLVTNSVGVLQFPSHTSYTGGIAFDTDLYLHRSAAKTLRVGQNSGGLGANLKIVGVITGNEFTFSESASAVMQVGSSSELRLLSAGGSPLTLYSNGAVALTLSPTQNLLVAGVTEAVGRLQFPSATTSAGGIAFGTDAFLFRSAVNTITFATANLATGTGTANAPQWGFISASGYGIYYVGVTMGLAVAGLTAILIDNALKSAFSGPIQLKSYVVSGLPAAATAGAGAVAYVTDSTATSITGLGLAVVGGGSNKVMVVSDGTNWIVI